MNYARLFIPVCFLSLPSQSCVYYTYVICSGGYGRGAVYVLFMVVDGTVDHAIKISDVVGSFTAILVNYDLFGTAAVGLGDLNGDGVFDMVVGAADVDSSLGSNAGACFVMFLNADGPDPVSTLFSLFVLPPAQGSNCDMCDVCCDHTGTTKSHQRIDETNGGFDGTLMAGSGEFASRSIENLGDLDVDGVVDIAVGAPQVSLALYLH